jgi:hypothetical protein
MMGAASLLRSIKPHLTPEILNHVAHRPKVRCDLIGNRDPAFFLDLHHQFNKFEGINAKLVPEPAFKLDLLKWNAGDFSDAISKLPQQVAAAWAN